MFSVFKTQYASNIAEGVDLAFFVIFGISLLFLIGITSVMIFFIIRYNRKRHPKATQIREHPWLEITWTLIPTALVMLMFYYGYIAFTPMRNAPPDAMVVKVIAKMWTWEFEYPGGKIANELNLPINKPVKLEMTSLDVVHSLFIPAFRVKEDVVPGATNFLWFIPQMPGTYEVLCTEYCGLRHSYMEARSTIMTQEEYDAWYAALPLKGVGEPEGLAIMKKNACLGCHSLDGVKLVGPTFKDFYGKTETVLVDGTARQITVDSLYVINAILNPDAEIVQGFNRGLMKSYKGVIPEAEIIKMYQYLKTLHAP